MKLKSIIKKLIPFMNINDKILKYYKHSYKMLKFKHKIMSRYYEYLIYKKYNCCISAKAKIDVNLILPHPIGIVIGEGTIIGSNCTIYQNVTLGRKDKDIAKYPVIGNNVIIYANSTIIGDVKIGNNAVIGCNSVVLRDIQDGEIVSGIVK